MHTIEIQFLTEMAMNLLKDAQNSFDFATYCPILYKAISDNDSIVPGYLYEEILKISFQSHQHRVHLVDFLLAKLLTSGWSGKQKIVRVLMQLSTKGHFGVRILIRQKDGTLRKAAAQDGPSDPVLANTERLFCNSAIQELLTVLFNPEIMKSDEEKLAHGENDHQPTSAFGFGYGSNGSTHGKYEGFGSSPINKSDSLVNQVCEIVGKISLSSDSKANSMKSLMSSDSGDYIPMSASDIIPLPSLKNSKMLTSRSLGSGPPMYSNISVKTKGHIAGKAGGGWESDEELEQDTYLIPLKDFVMGTIDTMPQNDAVIMSETDFINSLLTTFTTWPIDLELFISTLYTSVEFNRDSLMEKTREIMDNLTAMIEEEYPINDDVCDQDPKENTSCLNSLYGKNLKLMILLLFLEFGIYKELFLMAVVWNHFQSSFQNVSNSINIDELVKNKALKLFLLLSKCESESAE